MKEHKAREIESCLHEYDRFNWSQYSVEANLIHREIVVYLTAKNW
jgi:hypothetical protein